MLIYLSIGTSESPLTRIHSNVSSKLFTCILNSRMYYSSGSTNAIVKVLGISLFSLVPCDPAHRYTALLFNSDYGLLLWAHDVFTSVPGAGPELIDSSHVPVFLKLLTAHVTSQKKKYDLFYMGEKQITKQTSMCFTKQNTLLCLSRDILLKNIN